MRKLICICLAIPILMLINACGSGGKDSFRLTITPVPQEAGNVTPANAEFDKNRSLEISASANQNWVFDRWEGDHEGTQNPVIITMDSDKDIAAIFVKRDYPLTLLTEGQGQITERIVQQKTEEYPHGTVVELTAVPEMGWEFNRWEGDLDGNENPETITIEGETTVTAVFTRIEYPLTINIVGEGEVLEEVIQMKTTNYPEGTVVELTAVPDENWAFSEWSGDAEGADTTVTVTVDEPKEVTATFLRTFSFIPISQPEEGGEITPGASDYIRDSTFDVEAIPNHGWEFTGWEGDFSGTTNPFSLTMNGNKTIVANFERLEFGLDISVEGEGSFTTTLISGTETAGGFLFGSEVEIEAFPEENWNFMGWQGDIVTTANPVSVTIDENLSIVAVFSLFDGGDGSASNPFQISDVRQLQAVKDYSGDHFVLIDDIDASDAGSLNEGEGFIPIGTEANPFSGKINGNGFEISDLTINRPDAFYVGLFGYVDQGEIENISLQNTSVTGDDRVGALAGENHGTISNSYSIGTVTGSNLTGGLVGENFGEIENSYASGTVTGSSHTGGFAGRNRNLISDSYFTGMVEGSSFRTGGLVGTNTGLLIRTFSTGSVEGAEIAGGLVGSNQNNAEIRESYSLSNIEADDRAGGLAGKNDDGAPLILNSYARGSVVANGIVGGLVGSNGNDGIISSSYATGLVMGFSDVGGLAGTNSATFEASYWDTESTTQNSAAGAGDTTGTTGLTTGDMTGDSAEDEMPLLNWDTIWQTTETYPILQWQDD